MPLKFSTASSVEQICWDLRHSEFKRSKNRALINDLFNGAPPYTEQEVQDNNISTNVNDLSASVINASARRQVWNALITPNPLVTVSLDSGPSYKRMDWAQSITTRWNKAMMRSSQFMELRDGVGAQVILHGISPTLWEDQERWLQHEIGIEDVLIPANALRSLRNLPFLAIYRQYSANQLFDMTTGPNVDPAWNMPLVKSCLDWVDKQANAMLGQNWPAMWMPEKSAERWKSDSGCYATGAIPTIDCFDFLFYSDDGKDSGWKRRIVLDAWGQPGQNGQMPAATDRKFTHGKNEFLYNSEDRIYADKMSKFIHFQFGDASAVAPFRYHSVRSMGFLLYAVCHLQNRLKCRLSDACFESMLQYFRAENPTDAERAQAINLVDKGIIPSGVNFVGAQERWKIDQALITTQIEMNRQSMSDVSTAFSQNMEETQADETATLTMARVNSTAALVGSMLNRIYAYEIFRYEEIARRFCIPNSKDPDVLAFRLGCYHDNVPEEMLESERWNLTLTKVIGGGHKMMQVAIVDKLMATRPLHGPEAQAKILKLHDATVTDDWSLAEDLNPDQPHVSDSVHDSELAFGTLMQGSIVTPRPGLNPIEVIETILKLMAVKISQIHKSGDVGTPQDVIGLQNCAQYVGAFVQQLQQDPEMKQQVKQYGDFLGKAMNEVKAFAQRQQEAAQQAQQQNGHDPEASAKLEATKAQAEQKLQIASDTHALKTAQKRITFQEKTKQDAEKAQVKIATDLAEHQATLAKTGLEARHAQELHDKAKKDAGPKPE